MTDGGGRLVPAARRGLAHLARLSGDFPTALAAAQHLSWEGRHHRVLGDLYWLQGQPEHAAASYFAGRGEADQHDKAGEAAHCQALRAFTIAPPPSTSGGPNHPRRRHRQRRRPDHRPAQRTRQRRLCLAESRDRARHRFSPGRPRQPQRTDRDDRPAEGTDGPRSYFVDIAHFMAGEPLPTRHHRPVWLDKEQATRERWHQLVTDRRARLRGQQ